MSQVDKGFVRDVAELKISIMRFDQSWRNLATMPPKVQHDLFEFVRRSRGIYAVKSDSGYLVCGGKLCAHRSLDAVQYSEHRSELNGGQARAHIRGWADKVSADHPAHIAWQLLCAVHGVQPAPSYETFVVREDEIGRDAAIPDIEGKVVDLIVQLTSMLGPSSRATLKSRIAAL